MASRGLKGLKELLGNVCDAFIDLLLFVQFKKREKQPRRSDTLPKVSLLHGYFSRFFNCKNGTISRKASYLIQWTERMRDDILLQ